MMSKKNFKVRRSQVLPLAIAAAISSWAAPAAFAQAELIEEVVVTGSRIVRRDDEANSPIVTIGSELLENTASLNMEAALNKLPQFVPAATQFETTDTRSSASNALGASTVSLRGLGATRNLVLLDGRRAMPINATMAVDINSIPSAAIQRIEVITGGASSTYGADAMAGVVNFVLKKNFEGAEIDIQYGVSENGGGNEGRISALFGANFADGRGNVMFGGEYYDRQEVLAKDTDFYSRAMSDPGTRYDQGQFWQDTGYDTGSPGNIQFDPAISNITFNGPSQGAIDAIFDQLPSGAVTNGSVFNVNSDGTVYAGASAPRGGLPNSDAIYRYNGPYTVGGDSYRKISTSVPGQGGAEILQENQLLRMASIPLERYSIFGSGNYEINDKVSVFFQGNYSHSSVRTIDRYIGQRFPWGVTIPHGSDIWADSVLASGDTSPAYLAGGSVGVDCAPLGGCSTSEVFPTPAELTSLLDSRQFPNAPWALNLGINFVDPISSVNTNSTFQLIGGFEGDIDAIDGGWEVYVSSGYSEGVSNLTNFLSLERYRTVVSSPNYGSGFLQTGNIPSGGFLAGTGTCTTGLPVFTDDVSQDCIDAISSNYVETQNMQQDIFEANLQGVAFNLPAGEARFAAGVSYRKNTYEYLTASLRELGSFLDSALGTSPTTNSHGETEASDIYGELLLPVISDAPLIQELNLELGYRYSDNESVGGVDTYKALFDWSLIDSVRFRGGYQRATRAPNIGELFQSADTSFNGVPGNRGDYCSTASPGLNSANPTLNPDAAQVRAICEGLMTIGGAVQFYEIDSPNDSPATPAEIIIVGNPLVEQEDADTWTFGGVFQLNDEMSITADWYNIEITNLIAQQTQTEVLEGCFHPEFNPTYDVSIASCQQINRRPSTGEPGPTSATFVNKGAISTSGIDTQFNWETEFENIPGNFSLNVQASFLLEMKTKLTDTSEAVDWKGTFGPTGASIDGGAYDFRTFTTLSYMNGPFNVALRWRYLPEIDAADEATNPDTNYFATTDAYNIFDLSGGYSFGDNYFLRVGIDNLLDTKPSLTEVVLPGQLTSTGSAVDASTSTGITHAGYYDTLGRRFFVGLKATF